MKALMNINQLLSTARELETASRLTESVDLYQQIIDADPTNQQAVSRLLTIYRRLKEPKKELAVIETALTAYAQKDKTTQEKWLSAHPRAAKAGRAFLRSLGGSDVSSFGANAQAAIPSLFIISLRYLAPLDTIDAMLPKHTAFLDKHFAAGDFLVSGRQIPRTGGIIIARGKNRTAVERIMKQDPFLKNKLASVDIVEFAASKRSKKPW